MPLFRQRRRRLLLSFWYRGRPQQTFTPISRSAVFPSRSSFDVCVVNEEFPSLVLSIWLVNLGLERIKRNCWFPHADCIDPCNFTMDLLKILEEDLLGKEYERLSFLILYAFKVGAFKDKAKPIAYLYKKKRLWRNWHRTLSTKDDTPSSHSEFPKFLQWKTMLKEWAELLDEDNQTTLTMFTGTIQRPRFQTTVVFRNLRKVRMDVIDAIRNRRPPNLTFEWFGTIRMSLIKWR